MCSAEIVQHINKYKQSIMYIYIHKKVYYKHIIRILEIYSKYINRKITDISHLVYIYIC